MNPGSSDIDRKMVGWCVGLFIGGILVGAFIVAPMIEKSKKKGKKPDATAQAKP